MKPEQKFSGISGSTLKIIAILSMLIDHIGAAVLERGLLASAWVKNDAALFDKIRAVDRVLRLIGRPAFPIFCFLLVEGFLHTKDSKKYALRLLVFAFISEIPFDWAVRGNAVDFRAQNVFFTLLIGLLVMMAASYFSKNIWLQGLIFALGLGAGYVLKTDYGYKGVFLIELLYFLRYDRKMQCIAGALAFSWETIAPIAFLPILAYNGKRGLSMKYFFYLFYPAHLLILAGIAQYCAAL